MKKELDLREQIRKLKSGQDITMEEAAQIYRKIREVEKQLNEDEKEDVSEWLKAVADRLKMHVKGKFITSVPVRPSIDDFAEEILTIRSLLAPEERYSKVYASNLDLKEMTGPGFSIRKEGDLFNVESDRLGMIGKIVFQAFKDCRFYFSTVQNLDVFSDYERAFDDTPLKQLEYSSDIDIERLEFLKRLKIPFVLVLNDFKTCDWEEDPYDVYFDTVFIKDCDIARKAVQAEIKDIIEAAEKYGISDPKKKDVPDILMKMFASDRSMNTDDGLWEITR